MVPEQQAACPDMSMKSPDWIGNDVKRYSWLQIKAATHCTASVGIGPNMLLAKLATTHAKPDGVFRIRPGADVDMCVE